MKQAIAWPSKMMPNDWDAYAYRMPATVYKREEGQEPAVDLGNGHRLHAQEYGNPDGEPVIVLHGGPGGGCDTLYARYFDPDRFRIILFDQRGCVNSTPTTHSDLSAAMKGNNTAELVEDINAIRRHFNIHGKMHVEGGSWGSTLALAYAIKYPQYVKSLILRGVYLGRLEGIAYLFQGNAQTYNETAIPVTDASTKEEIEAFLNHYNQQDYSQEGAYRAYMGDGSLPGQIAPKYHAAHSHMIEAYAIAWDEFVRLIPKAERADMIKAYTLRLEAKADASKHETDTYDAQTGTIDPECQQRFAFAFAKWEGLISQFSQAVGADGKIDLGKFADPDFAVDFARLEARYSYDGFYLTEDGSPSPKGGDYLLKNLHRIAKYNVPIFIAHGANDQVCPVRDAYLLKEGYEKALEQEVKGQGRATVTMDIRPETGHSMLERGNTLALIELIRKTPLITPAEKAA